MTPLYSLKCWWKSRNAIRYSSFWTKKSRKYWNLSKKTSMSTAWKGIRLLLPGRYRVYQATSTKKATPSLLKTLNGSFPSVTSEWMKKHFQCKLRWWTTLLRSKNRRTTSKRKSSSSPLMWQEGCRTKLTSLSKPLKMKISHLRKSKNEESRWSRPTKNSLLTRS